MALAKYEIESMMDELDVTYFHRELDDGHAWVLPFDSSHIIVSLHEEGEYLRLLTPSILDLDELSQDQRQVAMALITEWNSCRKLGCYSGESTITFSIGVSIEDGTLTESQFRRYLGAVVFEAENHFPNLKAAVGCEEKDETSAHLHLMKKLLGRSSNSPGELN